MRDPDTATKVAFLRRPEVYAEGPRQVEVVETHMSWVFLTDEEVYKLKKPVRREALDFTTPELRRLDCEEEVRLNRRLAPDVYRGVVALTCSPDGALALGGEGVPVDWLVHMRRLPAERMLDALIEAGGVEGQELRPAALRLARFYAEAEPCELTTAELCERLRAGVEGDRSELLRPEFGLSPQPIEALAASQLAVLEREAALFEQRVDEGRVVEGHGDLRPEHICLRRGNPAIIDCLEFSRDLRLVDPADELAFLALECERLGSAVVGRWFFATYTEITRDDPPEALIRFYRNYRILRRAKLAVWHLEDPEVADHGKWSRRARRYLELALPLRGEGT